jgi:choline monooxygenase
MEPIESAHTINTDFYTSEKWNKNAKESIFARSWQLAGHERDLMYSDQQFPFHFMEGYLDEPLFLSKVKDKTYCLSNVCTHRGNLLIKHPQKKKKIVCDYHGRQFDTDGQFISMPKFEEAKDFPSACDHLTKVPLEQWGPFYFVSLEPAFDLKKALEPLSERLSFLPLSDFKFDATRSKDYLVNANWALYVENYLEGFHIPFVHPDLNRALSSSEYETIEYDYCNLQIGYAKGETDCFVLPQDHPDYGKTVAAYYFWLFPNFMLNFYPWGLSINIVRPLSKDQTKVSFLTYVYDEKKIEKGAGAILDKVEREDEFVVENVMRGVKSRFYKHGRYSPTQEKNLYHFHKLIRQSLNE